MPRRFQFSLRALLVATAIIASFFAGELTGRKRESLKFEAEREDMRFVYRQAQLRMRAFKQFQERLTPEFMEKARRYDDAQLAKRWGMNPEKKRP